jgi:tetratricopeptide (TPR) repeat protein
MKNAGFLPLSFCLFIVAASYGPATAQTPSAADVEIRFWQGRVAGDAEDHISAVRLGQAFLRKARESGEFKWYREAERAMETALARSPQDYRAQVSLAETLVAQHRFRDAIAVANRAIAAHPREPSGYGVIGDAHLESGNLDEAARAYSTLEQLAPGFAADTRQAKLAHGRGDASTARERLTRAIAHARLTDAPVEAIVWCQVFLGSIEMESDAWTAAERLYEDASRAQPSSVLALEHLAELRVAQKRYTEATGLYGRAIALAPRPEFFHDLGDALRAAGETARAEDAYAKALAGYLDAVDRGDPGYFRRLSAFYTDVRRDGTKAVMWARRDLEIRQDAETYATLAHALQAAGSAADAREASERARAMNPRVFRTARPQRRGSD